MPGHPIRDDAAVITDEQAYEVARRIRDAERTKQPTKQVSQLHPEFGIDEAYAIQRAGVELAESDGRVVRARKIGLTSKVMQDAVGISEPDHGVIYDDMFYGDGDVVPFDRFIAPRIEVELAFVLGADLAGPGCTLEAVLDATEYISPAIEILDARIPFSSENPLVADLRGDRPCIQMGTAKGNHCASLKRLVSSPPAFQL